MGYKIQELWKKIHTIGRKETSSDRGGVLFKSDNCQPGRIF